MRHDSIPGVLTRATRMLLTSCAALAVLTAACPPIAATPPDEDLFHSAPADPAVQPAGTVLAWREIAVWGLPIPISAWQMQFRSTLADGQPAALVGTVLIPLLQWPGGGPRPLLSYQIAEDSLGTECAPSAALATGRDASGQVSLDLPFIAAALLHGWAVVVPDFEGPYAQFLDGPGSGRAVLDGIRAARQLPPSGLAASPAVLWGYSGAAHATLWASELHATYAPELPLVGAAAGGVPADLPAIAAAADGGSKAGLTMLIVAALNRNVPDADLGALLNDRGRAMLADVAEACGAELLGRYANNRIGEYSDSPNLLADTRFTNVAQREELGTATPDIPLYLYQSASDDVIPVAGYNALVATYCARGATLTARHSLVPGHNLTAATESFAALAFLSDRLNGIPSPPGCL